MPTNSQEEIQPQNSQTKILWKINSKQPQPIQPLTNPTHGILLTKQQQVMNILQQQQKILSPEEFAIQQKELQALHAEKIKKEKTLKKLLQLTPEEAKIRPNLEEVNPENLNEITTYAARQNLACAFDCCADEDTAEDVENTANILKNTIPKGKFTHLTLYPEDNWEAIVLQNPQYASQYFIASIEDEPQNKEEQLKMQNEFKKVYNQLKQKNA